MAEDSATVHDAVLVDGILPLVPGLIQRLRAGIEVADVGCGQGHAVNLMARGLSPTAGSPGTTSPTRPSRAARSEAASAGLTNATFELRDVTELGVTEAYDLVTAFDAIHDQAHPARVLAGIASALRDDGVFLMVDVKASSHPHENLDLPWAPLLYTLSTMHCMTVSLALDGAGLGTVWGEQVALAMLGEAGFARRRDQGDRDRPVQQLLRRQQEMRLPAHCKTAEAGSDLRLAEERRLHNRGRDAGRPFDGLRAPLSKQYRRHHA